MHVSHIACLQAAFEIQLSEPTPKGLGNQLSMYRDGLQTLHSQHGRNVFLQRCDSARECASSRWPRVFECREQ
jgi:hypothetical protein